MKKRLLSTLLALVMLVSALTLTVSAYSDPFNPGGSTNKDNESFGWNIASSITESGSAVAFTDEAAYDAIAASVNVYLGQVAADATEADIDAAVAAGTLVEIDIGGYYGNRSVPQLSEYTIGEVNEAGLVVVARNGLTFTKSSICCNDVYGFNCQTAAAGNAGDFNDAIVSGTTKILVITPEMLKADGVYHEGRGNAWLMLSIGGSAEYSIIYNTRTGEDGEYSLDKVETLAAGAAVPNYTPEAPEGYVFSGWYTDENLTEKWHQPTTMPAKDIVVYGQFVPRADLTYIVHYYIKDTRIPVARDKVVRDQAYGATVTEEAKEVNGFVAEEPTTQELTLTEDKMEIIFYYTIKAPEIELETGEHFNYIIGYDDGTIRPDNNISRAEIATIFFRLMTEESRNTMMTTENEFSDVNDGSWYNVAVSTLANAGVLNGYPDGTFRPNQPITRAELAKVIALFADLKEGTLKFSDIEEHWARPYIELAAGNGWINGYPDGTFKPNQNIKRSETMAMINRVLDRSVSSQENMLEGMLTWSDCKPGAWYYYDVQEATNYHSYTRTAPNTIDEKWEELIENIDWAEYQF